MRTILCYFATPSEEELGSSSRGTWVKEGVSRAIEQGLEPALLPAVGLMRLTVAFSDGLGLELEKLAGKHGVAPGRMAGMLLMALRNLDRRGGAGSSSQADSTRLNEGIEPSANPERSTGLHSDRPEQRRLLAHIIPALQARKIVMVEAGTGVGKSRLAGRIAELMSPAGVVGDGRRTPLVIATPTVAQLAHLAQEMSVLQRNWVAAQEELSPPTVTMVLGRSQFIDLESAQEMAEQTQCEEALKWLASGAPCGLTQATRQMQAHAPTLKGLMEDWLVVAESMPEEFDPKECHLQPDSDELSLDCYEQLRASAHTHDIILCTHALVGCDLLARRRKESRTSSKMLPEESGFDTKNSTSSTVDELENMEPTTILPPAACFVIDEAHAFEQEVANVAAQSVSIHGLGRVMRSPKWAEAGLMTAARKCAEDCDRAILSMKHLQDGSGSEKANLSSASGARIILPAGLRDPVVSASWERCLPLVYDLSLSLAELTDRAREARRQSKLWAYGMVAAKRALRALRLTLGGKHVVEVTTTPKRRLANITCGPRSVAALMQILWGEAHSGVVMSGTLLLPTFMGDSSSYAKQMMSLPEERTVQVPAEHPAWTTTSLTMMLPDSLSRPYLTPPPAAQATEEQMKSWMQHVASAVSAMSKSAAGGSLVLCSSFDRISLLAEVLPEKIKERLVIQSRSGPSMRACQEKFQSMYRAGLRPIWLATGGAWTGLDLRDNSVDDNNAAADNLLSDVVIVNAPFGLNRSTTHAARCARLIKFESMSAAMLLRQGMGRLIRREGLLNRRLWMLDARLLARDASNGHSMFNQCALMLERYDRQQLFRLYESMDWSGK